MTWVQGANGGAPITDYVLTYRKSSGSTVTQFVHTPSTATTVTLTGLSRRTRYVVYVAMKNSVGVGPSTSRTFTTY